jgi:hypothetical protein
VVHYPEEQLLPTFDGRRKIKIKYGGRPTQTGISHPLLMEWSKTEKTSLSSDENYNTEFVSMMEENLVRVDLGNGRRFLNRFDAHNSPDATRSVCPLCGVFVLESFDDVGECLCVSHKSKWQTGRFKHSRRHTTAQLLENKNRFTSLVEEGLLPVTRTNTNRKHKRSISPLDSFLDDAGYQRLFEDISSQCHLDADMWIQDLMDDAKKQKGIQIGGGPKDEKRASQMFSFKLTPNKRKEQKQESRSKQRKKENQYKKDTYPAQKDDLNEHRRDTYPEHTAEQKRKRKEQKQESRSKQRKEENQHKRDTYPEHTAAEAKTIP